MGRIVNENETLTLRKPKQERSMKRVLELITLMGDGGAETLVKDYAIILQKLGMSVTVMTVYGISDTANMNQLRKAGVVVESILPRCSVFYRFVKHTFGFVYVPYRVLRIMKRYDVSCIHVHLNQLHHLVPISRLLNKVKILYTCHNTPEEYFAGISGRMEANAVRHFSKKDNFTLIALHEEMAGQLSSMFHPNHVEIIRNGIDFNRFTKVAISKSAKRKELAIPADAFVVGHVGRFFPQKNHERIIEAFKYVYQKNNKAFLLLVGDGPLENEIRGLLISEIPHDSYLILSHRSDIPEIMKAMDVFLFPSLFEGLPVTLIEAQVSQLPCVVSDVINKSAILLPTTTSLSLHDPIEKWGDTVMTDFPPVEFTPQIDQYDMNKEILRLRTLYES